MGGPYIARGLPTSRDWRRFTPFTADKLRTSSQLPVYLQPSSYPRLTSIPHHTEQLFTMVLKGHCLCKAVTYTVDVDQPLITGYDHCDDCQRQSGSTYCKLFSSTPSICKATETLDLAWSGEGELESFGRRHRGAGIGGPHPRNVLHTDGAKLSYDPCPLAGAPFTDPQPRP